MTNEIKFAFAHSSPDDTDDPTFVAMPRLKTLIQTALLTDCLYKNTAKSIARLLRFFGKETVMGDRIVADVQFSVEDFEIYASYYYREKENELWFEFKAAKSSDEFVVNKNSTFVFKNCKLGEEW